jgi:hypothetical protein
MPVQCDIVSSILKRPHYVERTINQPWIAPGSDDTSRERTTHGFVSHKKAQERTKKHASLFRGFSCLFVANRNLLSSWFARILPYCSIGMCRKLRLPAIIPRRYGKDRRLA